MRMFFSFFALLLAISPGFSQHKADYRSNLLLLNPSTGRTATLAEGSDAWYLCGQAGKYARGTLLKVSADTIFFQDTSISVKKITSLEFYINNWMTVFPMDGWKLIIPPPEVSSSFRYLQAYARELSKNPTLDTALVAGSYRQSSLYRKAKIHDEKEKMEHQRIMTYVDTIHKNFVKLDIIRLFWREAFMTYERRFSRDFGLEAGLGIQFSDGGVAEAGIGVLQYKIFPFYGMILTLGPKFYFSDSRKPYYYFMPLLLFKALWCYDEVLCQRDDTPYNSAGDYIRQDQFRSVYGFSVNLGTMKKLGSSFIVDFSMGLGIKAALVRQKAYSYSNEEHPNGIYYNPEHQPQEITTWLWNPIVNFSLKLGFGI
jgi:hypothetical protein